MKPRTGARLLLAGSCLLLLKLTGCPSPQPRPDRPPTGASTTPSLNNPTAVNPASTLPPEPPPPTGVPSRNQCPLEAAGRTCYVNMTDDGTPPPMPHPCQYPQVGQCDPTGQPMCLFRWKADGEPCNNNLGVCQNHRCRCNSERSCGYDCTQTCDAGSSCQGGICVAGVVPDPRPQPCGGCAHRSC